MKNFTLIICTYKRPEALSKLLASVGQQTVPPLEILVVDGSPDNRTREILERYPMSSVRYFSVPPDERGLTRQRNYGIQRVHERADIVCFLDDDTVLESDYFEQLIGTYKAYPDAVGVGGYIANESRFRYVGADYRASSREFFFDGWVQEEGSRFRLRRRFGLDTDCPPGFMPAFGHARSIGFLPPSGKTYPTQLLMGGVSSFLKETVTEYQFSTYFEGYGLYEDADFSIRVARTGSLYCNTAARLAHYHEPSGRPNQFAFGKMVVRNGWYVWRVANPRPSLGARVKWNLVTLLLTFIRFSNTFTGTEKKQAFTEALGRLAAFFGLVWRKPSL